MPKQTFDLTPSWLTILNILRALCAGDPDAKAKLGLIDELSRPIELLARSNAEIRASEERVAALPEVSETHLDYRCPRCQAAVHADGAITWDVETREWGLAATYDSGRCPECGWEGELYKAEREDHA